MKRSIFILSAVLLSSAMVGGPALAETNTAAMLQTMHAKSINVVSMTGKANTDHSSSQGVPPTNTTAQEQAKIRSAISANPELASMLKAKGISPDQIAAARVSDNDTLTVFLK